MVKFKSQVHDGETGSLAGTTAGVGRSGMYHRARSKPTRSRTNRATKARNATGTASRTWSSLTTAQQHAWTEYGRAVPENDPLGVPIPLTGHQAFIRANQPRINAGIAIAVNAPTVKTRGIAPRRIAVAVFAGPILFLQVATTGNRPKAGNMIVRVGPTQNAGRTRSRGRYRLLGQIPFTIGSGLITLTVPVANVPWGIVSGSRVPFRIIYSYADGRTSTELTQLFTVS